MSIATDGKQDRAPPESATPAGPPRNRVRRGARTLLVLAVTGAIAFAGYRYWQQRQDFESTDDAFVDGNVARISARVGGPVARLLAGDNQLVEDGALLLEIDPADYRVAVQSARATVAAARARLVAERANLELTRVTAQTGIRQAVKALEQARAAADQARAEAAAVAADATRARDDDARYRRLYRKHEVSRQRVDQAATTARMTAARQQAEVKAVAVAEARIGEDAARLAEARAAPHRIAVEAAEVEVRTADLEQAKAALAQAELNLSYTRIYAPHRGRITNRAVERGDVVRPEQVLAALVFGERWIRANFKETQLTRMRPGQSVSIRVDSYPDRALRGHVESIQAGTGARFSLLPPENATGNFVKVVQRVPVKILFDDPPDPRYPLALGMSVVPIVDLRSGSGAAAGGPGTPGAGESTR